MIDPDRRNHIAIQDVVDGVPPVPIEELMIADEGPLADEQTHTVNIPKMLCPLSDSMKEMFVHGLQETVHIDEAVTAYMHARNHLYQLVNADSSSDSDEYYTTLYTP